MTNRVSTSAREPSAAPREVDGQGAQDDEGPRLSVLVATRDRATFLRGMLESLATEWDAIDEFVIVDNGSTDDTPEILARFADERPQLRTLELATPGKARALNLAIEESSGPAVAFLDDDVLVQPGWAAAMREAFRTTDHAGFQGRIRFPEAVRADPEKMARHDRYRTLPVADWGEEPIVRKSLTGANMGLRREWFERVGPFDPKLGPGASGFSEDTELGDRIRAVTGRGFAYLPSAEVHHVFEESRVTEEAFRAHHEKIGASRQIEAPRSLPRIVWNLVGRRVRAKIAQLRGDERGAYHNLGRYFAYRKMMRMSVLGESGDTPAGSR